MALVIEDGSVVADANSYATIAELRAYAASRGASLPVTDAEVESLLIRAADYLGSFEQQYVGTRQSVDQELSWPRTGAYVNGFIVEDDEIPKMLKRAQMQTAIEVSLGFDPLTGTSGSFVKRTKVDVIETEFATPLELGAGYTTGAQLPAVAALLAPMLRNSGTLRSVRV